MYLSIDRKRFGDQSERRARNYSRLVPHSKIDVWLPPAALTERSSATPFARRIWPIAGPRQARFE